MLRSDSNDDKHILTTGCSCHALLSGRRSGGPYKLVRMQQGLGQCRLQPQLGLCQPESFRIRVSRSEPFSNVSVIVQLFFARRRRRPVCRLTRGTLMLSNRL
jgi:hypothetical protein